MENEPLLACAQCGGEVMVQQRIVRYHTYAYREGRFVMLADTPPTPRQAIVSSYDSPAHKFRCSKCGAAGAETGYRAYHNAILKKTGNGDWEPIYVPSEKPTKD